MGLPHGRLVYSYLDEDGGHRAVEAILAAGAPPEAIVCGSDVIAAGVLGALRAHGLDTPGDVAATGFDGMFPDTSLLGSLTTICQPRAAMSAAALARLVARIAGVGGPCADDIHPHRRRVRTSCGCAAPASAIRVSSTWSACPS
ncbi:substrate-binding domain-containing protein [Agilicoccus flavus]|uniref:substrate-binding domain-containing protein n=1 Tax=Agilicoccus flavus TaxID=2775968 RepID=UPI0035591CD2